MTTTRLTFPRYIENLSETIQKTLEHSNSKDPGAFAAGRGHEADCPRDPS